MLLPALTLHQPWASAIVLGHKTLETRPRSLRYRGDLAIHAAASVPEYARMFLAGNQDVWAGVDLPQGSLLAVVRMVDCLRTEVQLRAGVSAMEFRHGNYEPGRWVYVFDNIRVLSVPIAAGGKQGLWRLQPYQDAKVREQVQVGPVHVSDSGARLFEEIR